MMVKINTKNAGTYLIKSNFMDINNQILKILKKSPPFDFDNFYGTHANPYKKEIESRVE